MIELESLDSLKEKYQVPESLQSCHTAIVDGYILEGHVPVAEINRLLTEKPDVIGIAVAGMPVGSPGMEIEGFGTESFEVVMFNASGDITLYATYPAD